MIPTIKQPRPKLLRGTTTVMETGCVKIYVQVNILDDRIFEVFCTMGKTGECGRAFVEALTRCITVGLRSGVPVEEYIRQLQEIRCLHPSLSAQKVLSCPDAIRQVLIEEQANLDRRIKEC